MGNISTKDDTVDTTAILSDVVCTVHHVRDGGCAADFKKPVSRCHPVYMHPAPPDGEGDDDEEACVKATAALRRCFAGTPEWLGHHYIRRMDEGLDEDLKPSPEQVKERSRKLFRWWTGMKRSC